MSLPGDVKPVSFCMHCGDILNENHHLDCPTRKGRVWLDGKWVKAKAPACSVVAAQKMPKQPWREGAIWLRQIDNGAYVVEIERNGQWIEVIRDRGCCSHIVESLGIDSKIADAEVRP